MAIPLTPLETAFLIWEDSAPLHFMHFGGALVFEPGDTGEVPTLDQLRARISERLAILRRFKLQLSTPALKRFSRPSWVEPADFDIETQVRSARLPSPGGEEELASWLCQDHSVPLPRTRPLWSVVLLEGLAEGRWALALKVHHSLVDGIGGMVAAAALFLDLDADALRPLFPETRDRNGARPNLAAAAKGLAKGMARRGEAEAPPTSLDVPVGRDRRIAAVEIPLEEVDRIRRSLGGTVNDVVLAGTAEGVRRLLHGRGEYPPVVRAMVPVNARTEGNRRSLDVHVSSVYVDLPIATDDLLRRYRETVVATSTFKAENRAGETEDLLKLAAKVPPVLQQMLERALSPGLPSTLTVTNVAGPPIPLAAFGSNLIRVRPIMPVTKGHPVIVAALSYAGTLIISLTFDPVAIPDFPVFKSGVEDSLRQLGRLAE